MSVLSPRRATSLLLVVAVLTSLVVFATPAYPADPEPPQWVFPVVGQDGVDFAYSDTFGACRGSGCSRSHHGVDIGTYGVKGVPVVAAADGVVRYVNWSWTPDDLNPDRCCTIAIDHAGGWETWYIHLDNDTPGTDDGLGWGIADGIVPGVSVTAGQLIGWVGDSGNAEGTIPHLHWEVHAPGGIVVNPTPHADSALRIAAPGQASVASPCASGTCDTITAVDPGGIWNIWDELAWPTTKNSFYYGNPGDYPFMGDWDGDGTETPGLYRQSDGFVYVRDTNTQGVADLEFFFGNPGDVPLVGDFDGDGRDSVSVWRTSQARVYIINELGEDGAGLGAADFYFDVAESTDVPFVGDFDGDGVDTIGFFRPATGMIRLLDANADVVPSVEFSFGNIGDQFLVGDWVGDGRDTIAAYRPSTGRIYLRFTNATGNADWDAWVGDYPHVISAGRG